MSTERVSIRSGADAKRVLDETGPDGRLIDLGDEIVYITGTKQSVSRIHDPFHCAGEACVIHNPSDHSMREFPTHWRDARGIMERICPHGVGHPDPDDLAFHVRNGREHEGVHGCDGCCFAPGEFAAALERHHQEEQ